MARPRKLNRHLPKYVELNNGTYYYRPTHGESVRMTHADGTSIRHGQEAAMYGWLADKAEPIAMPDQPTLADCFARYKRDVLPTLAPRTQKDYLRALDVLEDEFGARAPDDVKPRDIGRFLDVRKGKIHRNRQVAVLSAVYSKCVGRWYCADRNPCSEVERNASSKRTRYVTDAEYKIVYDAMPPRIQITMDLAVITGQRQGDLLKLRWEDVTPEGVLFVVSKTRKKVGKKLLVEMSPTLEAILTRARKMLPHLPREYVIRTEEGLPYTPEGFRAIWQRRMKRLCRGYYRKPRGKEPVWVPPALPERYTFHDLRAKSVSDSDTIELAYERAGHTSMAMTRSVYDRGVRKVKPLR